MLNVDAIRSSIVNTSTITSKENLSYETSILPKETDVAKKTLEPSEAAKMLYASGASGATRVTYSEQSEKPLSIYDFSMEEIKTALDEMRVERQSINYEGMTDSEIYSDIVKRYMDKFGVDISVPNTSRELIDGGEMITIDSPRSAMWVEIVTSISDGNKLPETIREANGYANLSNSEITARVREKYPEPNTVRDYMLMKWELQEMGIGNASGVNEILQAKICGLNGLPDESSDGFAVRKKLWENLLDTPASFDSLEKLEADFEAGGKKIHAMSEIDIGSILDLLGSSMVLASSNYEALKERLANSIFDLLAL